MKFEIENRWSGKIIFSIETDSWRLAVEAAVKSRADLSGANLYGANLSGADLSGANLSDADLSGANLYGANLYGADLSDADLSGADLSGADLSRADLSGANLYGADLSGAKGLERLPIQISGHKHWLQTTQRGDLQIGCYIYTFKQWLRHAEQIGKKEGYSALDVKIYKLHIAHIQKVSQLLWNAKKRRQKWWYSHDPRTA